MDFELFNYLIASISNPDKNCEVPLSSSAPSSISVHSLSTKIQTIDPNADLDELQNLFDNRSNISSE
jgi:hypothetical protein